MMLLRYNDTSELFLLFQIVLIISTQYGHSKLFHSIMCIVKHVKKQGFLHHQAYIILRCHKMKNLLFYSILFYSITLEGRRGTTYEFATIPFHLVLFSAALIELAKFIPVPSLILSSHLFFCLPLFLFPFTVPCRIIFAKPEDLETWPDHLSIRFLTRVRSSSYSPMAAWIFLRTSSLVTCS